MLSKAFRLIFILAMTLGVWFTATSYTFAQGFRATIIGQVADPSGAAVPGAKVTAVEKATGQIYTGKSNASGVFSIAFVMPGHYSVTIEAKGFQKKVYTDVTLSAAQKLNLNVKLTLGSTKQTVTVTASPGLLNTTDASSSTVLNSTMIENLPAVGRESWQGLITAQGVMVPGRQLMGLIKSMAFPQGEQYIVDGAPTGANAFYINGAPVSTARVSNVAPLEDAVQELQVNNNAGAEYGHNSGGNFNAVLKSGTNQFHGDIYDYYQSSALNANTATRNRIGTPKPSTMDNHWGATIGGPVLLPGYNGRNKTFFFFGTEGDYEKGSNTFNLSVPTVAERNGNFQGTGYTIYDPSTVTCVTMTASGCSQYRRTAFANDIVPSTSINPIGQHILKDYPVPNMPGSGINYGASFGSLDGNRQYISRVDHTFTNSTRLYGVYMYASHSGHGNVNYGLPGIGGDAQPGVLPVLQVDQNAILDLTQTISSSTVLDVRLSFGRIASTLSGIGGNVYLDKYSLPGLTMPFVPTTPEQNLAPRITLSGYPKIYDNLGPRGYASNNWDFGSAVTQLAGRHTLHYGFEFQDYQWGPHIGNPGDPNGNFHFDSQWTRQDPLRGHPGSGNSWADLLLGLPSSGSINWASSPFISNHYYALYLQDDFKFRKDLTLNAGLRWEVMTPPTERHNGINGPFCFTCTNPYTSQIDYTQFPNLQNPLLGGLTFAGVTAPTTPQNTPLSEFGPRLGFAWSITPKTVFRAGFGVFYDNEQNVGGYQNGGGGTTLDGFSQTTSYVPSLDGGITPSNYFANGVPYPNGVIAPLGAAGGYATNAGNGIYYYGPNSKVSMTEHYNAGIQRELPSKILLDVEYVGAHTHALPVDYPWSGALSTAQMNACYQDSSICNSQVSNPFYGVLPLSSGLGSSPTFRASNLMVSYPVFSSVDQGNDPLGYSKYNSLSVRVQRRVKSANFVFNYRYANDLQADQFLNYVSDPTALWYGPRSNAVRHWISTDVNLPLPVGQGGLLFRGAHGVLGQIINHWEWISVVTYSDGTPFAPLNATLTGAPGCTSYAPPGGTQTSQAGFNNNPACYQTLAPYQLRTAPLYINYVRNSPTLAWDGALQKNFALPREGMSLQVRAQCTFCSNSTMWGGPNTNINSLETLSPTTGYNGFGAIQIASIGARIVELSAKITF